VYNLTHLRHAFILPTSVCAISKETLNWRSMAGCLPPKQLPDKPQKLPRKREAALPAPRRLRGSTSTSLHSNRGRALRSHSAGGAGQRLGSVLQGGKGRERCSRSFLCDQRRTSHIIRLVIRALVAKGEMHLRHEVINQIDGKITWSRESPSRCVRSRRRDRLAAGRVRG